MNSTPPACYGTMFPDLAGLEYNVPCRGKALEVELRSHGIGVQARELRVDEEAWAACTACPAYRTCYDLCMAKLVLERALASF